MKDYRQLIMAHLNKLPFIKNNKKQELCNVPMSFDIETTSTYVNGEKQAFMYIWMFGIENDVYYGRTWDDFLVFTDLLSSQLELHEERKIIVYVHNLAFEFQFIYKLFKWTKVFALNPHKPIYALTDTGIEFRCSYLLSGYKLEKVAENLRTHNIEKLVGNLDYDLIRTHETPMTKKELEYCEHDIKIIQYYIYEQLAEYQNNINYIPLTNTGRVRNYCRKRTLYADYDRYSKLMRSLILTDEEYMQLKKGFQGGFTHANHIYADKTVNGVTSKDFASSYPYVMVSEKYPMSAPQKVNDMEHFEYYLDTFCCIFDIEFSRLESIQYEHPLSVSRCWDIRKPLIDNGRVVMADSLRTTITEQDYRILEQFYDWEYMNVTNMRIMEKQYLPREFIMSILHLYRDKTSLKDVQGKEIEYLRSKGMINSCYGMTVTDIARDEIMFNNANWKKEKPNLEQAMHKYNTSKRRFLYYPWGVWVTAYARRNLFTGIFEFGKDYVYADTDSIKVRNIDKHMDYINLYNAGVEKKLRAMCDYYKIPFHLVEPKAPNGERKRLGVWADDGEYTRFKTLGAKRYMTEENGKINITVSGLNKKVTVPYLLETYGDKIFDAFTDDLTVPAEYTGKMTHTYIDEERTFYVTDYLGNTTLVCSPSGVHLEKAPYELSLSQAYIDYIRGIREEADYL